MLNEATGYYLYVKGKQLGPFAEPQLRDMWGASALPDDALCWMDGWENWRSLKVVMQAPNSEQIEGSKKIQGDIKAHVAAVLKKQEQTTIKTSETDCASGKPEPTKAEAEAWLAYAELNLEHPSHPVKYTDWKARMEANGRTNTINADFDAAKAQHDWHMDSLQEGDTLEDVLASHSPATDEEVFALAKALFEFHSDEHAEWDGSDPSHVETFITAVQNDLKTAGFELGAAATASAMTGEGEMPTYFRLARDLRAATANRELAELNLRTCMCEIELSHTQGQGRFRAHDDLGKSLQGMGYHLEAIHVFSKALAMAEDTDKPMVLYKRALSRHDVNELEGGIADLRLALKLAHSKSDDPKSQKTLRVLEIELKRFAYDLEHRSIYKERTWPSNFALRPEVEPNEQTDTPETGRIDNPPASEGQNK